jgi:hypothetical protein
VVTCIFDVRFEYLKNAKGIESIYEMEVPFEYTDDNREEIVNYMISNKNKTT